MWNPDGKSMPKGARGCLENAAWAQQELASTLQAFSFLSGQTFLSTGHCSLGSLWLWPVYWGDALIGILLVPHAPPPGYLSVIAVLCLDRM